MATPMMLQPPSTFNIEKPEEWGKWKSRIQQYRMASGLSDESGEQQVCALLYCMGDGSEDVLNMTYVTEENRKNFDTVIEKFTDHFRNNTIFERACFNQRNQEQAESICRTIHHSYPPNGRSMRVRCHDRQTYQGPI